MWCHSLSVSNWLGKLLRFARIAHVLMNYVSHVLQAISYSNGIRISKVRSLAKRINARHAVKIFLKTQRSTKTISSHTPWFRTSWMRHSYMLKTWASWECLSFHGKSTKYFWLTWTMIRIDLQMKTSVRLSCKVTTPGCIDNEIWLQFKREQKRTCLINKRDSCIKTKTVQACIYYHSLDLSRINSSSSHWNPWK